MTKVRVNSLYSYKPCIMDAVEPRLSHVPVGSIVRVINLRGCPKANVMAHCYIEFMDKKFIGLVSTGSLIPVKRQGKHITMALDDYNDFNK